MKSNLKKEKGVALVLTVLISGIFLGIALGVAHLITQQLVFLREAGFAQKAFYIADTGIEETMLNFQVPLGSVPFEGGEYRIICECCDKDLSPNCPNSAPLCPSNCPPASPSSNCQASNFCLKSIGEYRSFRQAIQLDI